MLQKYLAWLQFGAITTLLVSWAMAFAAPQNPPPAKKFAGYAGYDLSAMQIDPELAEKKNADKVLAKVQASMHKHVQPLVDSWNGSADAAAADRLRIEPRIVSLHKPSGANRFFAGAFAGQSRIIVKVRIVEAQAGALIAEPEFYQHANALGGAWSIGATDNAMLERVTELIATYLRTNYDTPVGGATGYEN